MNGESSFMFEKVLQKKQMQGFVWLDLGTSVDDEGSRLTFTTSSHLSSSFPFSFS